MGDSEDHAPDRYGIHYTAVAMDGGRMVPNRGSRGAQRPKWGSNRGISGSEQMGGQKGLKNGHRERLANDA